MLFHLHFTVQQEVSREGWKSLLSMQSFRDLKFPPLNWHSALSHTHRVRKRVLRGFYGGSGSV